MPDNADQIDFWNDLAGPIWVARESDLDALHQSVSDRLLEACAPRTGEAILDVGCGGGATSLAFADAVGPSGRVLGIDISAPLLDRAEARRRAAGLDHVAFVRGDAQTQALPVAGFDAAISRFGVMFFADPVAAFRNIAGALRPGGRIVFAAWAGTETNPWFALPFRVAADRLGPVKASPPDAPGPMAFADADRVTGLLRTSGLTDVSAEKCRVELHHPGGVAAITRLASEVGPAVRLVREKNGSDEDIAAISREVGEAFTACATEDGIRIPAEIILYRATRS